MLDTPAIEHLGFFSHTYCDKGHQFVMVISEDCVYCEKYLSVCDILDAMYMILEINMKWKTSIDENGIIML